MKLKPGNLNNFIILVACAMADPDFNVLLDLFRLQLTKSANKSKFGSEINQSLMKSSNQQLHLINYRIHV